MRAVRNTEGGVAVVDVDEPAGDGVVLDVSVGSICGTDTGLIAMGSMGYTLGHEFAGTVDGVPYAVEPSLYCGKCDQCVAGFTQRCVGERGTIGIFSDGGLADHALVPQECLIPLPAGLDVSSDAPNEISSGDCSGAAPGDSVSGGKVRSVP